MNITTVLQSAGKAGGLGSIRAMVLTEPGHFELRDVDVPAPGAGQVRVRLEGCGVCASNIPPFEGRAWFEYPFEAGQLGHEGWGRIEEVGTGVRGFKVGDRVAFVSEHAYAECDVAAEESLVPLPPALECRPFPGEPLGCATNILKRSGILPGDKIAIVGIGFLGAMLTRLASAMGASVIAVARRPFAQSVATEMGAEQVIAMHDHWQIIERVKQITSGRFCDVVIECTGKQWPLDLSAELTRERGRLVVAGYHQDGPRSCNLQLWNWRGLDVINAHERDPRVYVQGMRQAVAAAVSGQLDVSRLITHEFELERLGEAMEMTRERPDGFLKAIVKMNHC